MSPARQTPRRIYPWETPDEVVRVETPEQITVEYRIAPFGARIVAALLDQLIIIGILVVLFLAMAGGIGAFLIPSRHGSDLLPWAMVAYLLAVFFVQVGYFVWFEMRWEGATPGKRRIGLRSVMADGRGLTFGAVLVRNLARLLDDLALLWLVPLFDRRRRRLGDFLAGTLVVRADGATGRAGEFRFDPGAERTDPDRRDFFFPAHIVDHLFEDDLNLVEHLLARLPTVHPASKRDALLKGVAERYRDRLQLQDQAERIGADPQRFVFELYLLLKSRYEKEVY